MGLISKPGVLEAASDVLTANTDRRLTVGVSSRRMRYDRAREGTRQPPAVRQCVFLEALGSDPAETYLE